jgi:hypothetical protein
MPKKCQSASRMRIAVVPPLPPRASQLSILQSRGQKGIAGAGHLTQLQVAQQSQTLHWSHHGLGWSGGAGGGGRPGPSTPMHQLQAIYAESVTIRLRLVPLQKYPFMATQCHFGLGLWGRETWANNPRGQPWSISLAISQ